MDKNVSQLDPKLKEAYDRVMGTVVTPPVKATPTAMSATSPSVPPLSSTPLSPTPTMSVNPLPTTSTTAINHQAVSVPISNTKITTLKKKSGAFKALIFMFAGIVFFIIYALVWIKMFNLKFPYLNP